MRLDTRFCTKVFDILGLYDDVKHDSDAVVIDSLFRTALRYKPLDSPAVFDESYRFDAFCIETKPLQQ